MLKVPEIAASIEIDRSENRHSINSIRSITSNNLASTVNRTFSTRARLEQIKMFLKVTHPNLAKLHTQSYRFGNVNCASVTFRIRQELKLMLLKTLKLYKDTTEIVLALVANNYSKMDEIPILYKQCFVHLIGSLEMLRQIVMHILPLAVHGQFYRAGVLEALVAGLIANTMGGEQTNYVEKKNNSYEDANEMLNSQRIKVPILPFRSKNFHKDNDGELNREAKRPEYECSRSQIRTQVDIPFMMQLKKINDEVSALLFKLHQVLSPIFNKQMFSQPPQMTQVPKRLLTLNMNTVNMNYQEKSTSLWKLCCGLGEKYNMSNSCPLTEQHLQSTETVCFPITTVTTSAFCRSTVRTSVTSRGGLSTVNSVRGSLYRVDNSIKPKVSSSFIPRQNSNGIFRRNSSRGLIEQSDDIGPGLLKPCKNSTDIRQKICKVLVRKKDSEIDDDFFDISDNVDDQLRQLEIMNSDF
ncbi:hypothetical protein SNEBB_006811 [Seison nebaliae]|nr:hypothetical protein SNEBB_006811 [Seison nebaliae]